MPACGNNRNMMLAAQFILLLSATGVCWAEAVAGLPSVTRATSVVLEGQALPGSTVSLLDASTAVTLVRCDAAGRYSFGAVDLTEGANRLVVRRVDESGQARVEVHEVLRDSTPPAVRVLSPGTGLLTHRNPLGIRHGRLVVTSVNVLLSAEPGSRVELLVNNESRGTVEVDAGGEARFLNTRLPQTQVWIGARATDAAGNVGLAPRVWLGQPSL